MSKLSTAKSKVSQEKARWDTLSSLSASKKAISGFLIMSILAATHPSRAQNYLSFPHSAMLNH
jgi:hypothetical protein